MSAGKLDIVVEEGADFFLHLTWLDNSGSAIDLTGYSAAMKIKEAVGGALIDDLTSSLEITLGGSAGTIQVDIGGSVTAAYDFDWGVYDLWVDDGSGVVTWIVEGAVKFSREVSD